MSIANLIVHEVQKAEGESKALLVARPTENPIDADAEQLAAKVTNLFNRSGMNTGQFSNPEGSEEGSKLPALLHNHFNGQGFDDFAAFAGVFNHAAPLDQIKVFHAMDNTTKN